MGILFDGEFEVPAPPDAVMTAFADVPRMASLMPGAFIEGQDEDGAWRGGMLVAFGPKKIRFQGKVTLQLDHAARNGTMVGRGSADMRAARVETQLRFGVKPAPGAPAPASLVTLSSDTAMTGVLAEFAKAGGPAVARVLMEEFARRLREELTAATAQSVVADVAAMPAAPGVVAVGAHQGRAGLRVETVLWNMLRRWFRQFAGRRASER